MKTEINKSVFEKFPLLESERLVFREIIPGDSEDLFLIRGDNDVMRFMDIPKMILISDSEKMIQSCGESFTNGNGINWGIIEKSSNNFIGYFGFWRLIKEHCRGEIGYALNKKYWGKGYMTECIKTMIKFGFRELNLHSIEANVNPGNEKSILLLERSGFSKEAYLRENYLFEDKFLDTITYSLLESDLKDI
jgi:ribosomal-protein-alanine N-acetyltransferase